MDFNFTDEQSMLRDTVASYLTDHYGFDQRQAATESGSGRRPQVWRAFAEELGILGAAFSEEQGGLGGGAIENMIIMEEIGKQLVVEPYLGTVVIGGGFLKHSGAAIASEMIGKIISGEALIAFAYAEPTGRYNLADLSTKARRDGDSYVINGRKAVVVGAPWATQLVVTARTAGGRRDAQGVSVFLVDKDAPGITTQDYPTVDGGRASEVTFDGVRVPAERLLGEADQGLPLVERVVDEAIAAVCAEAVGTMRRMHEQTVDYARQRRQFGAPIASFQVLQHRMVDMFMAVEQAVSMTYMATLKLDEADAERAKAASAAKVQIGRGARFVGQNAVQIHGGMGMTNELAVGWYFKRATMIEGLFGSVDHHLRRYENLTLSAAA